MFSEYASRFLAQSQSRISNFIQPENHEALPRSLGDQSRSIAPALRHVAARQYLGRQTLGNPYLSGASHLSNFPFASRLSVAPDAPLFHSALDDFREEDDEEEQEREWADRYALERSRRVWGASHLGESSETQKEDSNASLQSYRSDDGRLPEERGRIRGIRSSWNGGVRTANGRGIDAETDGDEPEDIGKYRERERQESRATSNAKGEMVDVGLESTLEDTEPPDDLAVEMSSDTNPPAFQQFRSTPKTGPTVLPSVPSYLQRNRDIESAADITRPQSVETVPPSVPVIMGEPPTHDVFWSSLYLICLASLFATFLLVFLHTSAPKRNGALGDTIYNTLSSSFHLLAVDTVISVVVSLIWLASLRSFVRPLVYLIVGALPVILLSFSLYPFISSYKGTEHGNGFQDKIMRWLSFGPAIVAAVWVYTIYQGRHSLAKAIGVLEFSSKILSANPALLPLGFGILVAIISWTWVWLAMFTRVFLGGHTSRPGFFIIDLTTWWLAIFFVFMYIWTLSILGGIQRATTAATVSQWYFHRNAETSPNSRVVVNAAFQHAITTLLGTVCLSSLLNLLIRLPVFVLPRRLMGFMSVFAYSLIPTPITALINPLSLTFAAVRSQPLGTSARSLSQMSFLGPQAPTSTLNPRPFSIRTQPTPSLLSYRLSKVLLYATRFMMATALGFGGWVATARKLAIDMPSGTGLRGSAYAYVVGIVASFIGWGVLGAIEGVLSCIVDASVVCWGIEKSTQGGGAYCLEAGYLFGETRGHGDER